MSLLNANIKAFDMYAKSPKSHNLHFVACLRRCLELAGRENTSQEG